MRAFIDAEVPKAELVDVLAWHREKGRLAQGWYYWRHGRGCAVGCTLHEFAPGEEEDHRLYERLFGIPESLAYLEDSIFEGLDVVSARTWPERFARAIPEGANLGNVADRIALWIIGGEDGPMAQWRDRDYLQPTLDLYRQHLDGEESRRGAWRKAARVARDGGKAAGNSFDYDAGWAAAHGRADGEYHKLAADAVILAAKFAGKTSQENERARVDAWKRIADKLIELLETAEVSQAEGE